MISIQRDLQEDFSGALMTIEEANKNFPSSPIFDRYKLDIYLLAKDNDKALELISKILVNDPDNSQLSLRRAVLHDERIKEIKATEPLDSLALQNELAL